MSARDVFYGAINLYMYALRVKDKDLSENPEMKKPLLSLIKEKTDEDYFKKTKPVIDLVIMYVDESI